jgi:hypothetical protein
VSLSDLEFAQSCFINSTFVRTADENYCVARWARQNKFYTDFAWSAVHCLEKYMKAILLFNGKSVKKYGHNINKLFNDVAVLAGDLLTNNLQPDPNIPDQINVRHITMAQFISSLYEIGNSDARYGIVGHYVTSDDLIHLDSLVYALRRIIVPLEAQLDGHPTPVTYRKWLKDNPNNLISKRGLLWERIESDDTITAGSVANCNLAFAPDFNHDWQWIESSWRESPIERDISGALRSDDCHWAKQGIDFSEWLMANVKLGQSLNEGIKILLSNAKNKHYPSCISH